jgi:uncharacterized SAM-binding protein YcdF (DUF218 family)
VARGRHLLLRIFLASLLIVAVLIVTSQWWLPGLGWALIRDEGPAKADLAVVLAGDYWGYRISHAADLVRAGDVPAVLVSGPDGFYGKHECDFAIAYAIGRGYPAQYFIPFPNQARSTREEAQMILPELQRRGIHRILLVTSDYHTRRAARIFRAANQSMRAGVEIRVVAAPDKEFQPSSWWRTRQGQKIAFMEWSKTLASSFGL